MHKLPDSLLKPLLDYLAMRAFSAASMRGPGMTDLIRVGRSYCATQLALQAFSVSDDRRFQRALDRATRALLERLPRRARYWGMARKGLNIFLREATYNIYLREMFGLHKSESLLELPIDSTTAKAMLNGDGSRSLRWTSIRALTPESHRQFQQLAEAEARARKVKRVHLDLLWYPRQS